MKTKYTSLKDLTGALKEKSDLIRIFHEEAGPAFDLSKVKCLGEGDSKAKLEKLDDANKELADLNDDYKTLVAIQKSRQLADEVAGYQGADLRETPGTGAKSKLSLGQQFVKSAAYLERGKEATLDVNLKSIMQTAAGWDPENMRLPRVELYPLRRLRVVDVFPSFPIGGDTAKYMEETTHTNNAAELAEETNAAAPTAAGEAALALTERSVPVENIAVWIPVSEQQLADVVGIGPWIESRLTYMILNRLDAQLVAGNGNTPNIRGVLNASNIQSQALGTDTRFDAIFKAMTKVRGVTAGTGFAEPNVVLVHPNDWEPIRLARTADGLYIMGNPADSGPERLFGVPVIVTPAETENTILVGDFAGFAELRVRDGIQVKISDSHASLFTAFTLAIRANMRAAAIYYRGSAFCKVTGV